MFVVGSRARDQPPPPRIVHEALRQPNRDPSRPWLKLLDDEVEPAILAADEPTLVVWSSLWLKRPRAEVRFDLTANGPSTMLRWTLTDIDEPEQAMVGHLRKRMNQLINAELRYSFGQ